MKKTKLFNGSIIALLVAMLLTTSLAVAQTTPGLNVTKTVTPDPNVPFQYNVTLEAWSTGSTKDESITTTKPAHIVMILDNGAYMNYYEKKSTETAAYFMKKYAVQVIDNFLASPSSVSGSPHKVSIISCNYPDNDSKIEYSCGEISSANADAIKTKINGISLKSSAAACAFSKGLSLANSEFNSTNAADYQKIIIFFACTVPGDQWSEAVDHYSNVSKNADTYIKDAKKLSDTKIFVVDLFCTTYNDTKNKATAMQNYLKALSSDYPNPSSDWNTNGLILTLGSSISSPKYYQNAYTSTVDLSVGRFLESTTTSTTVNKPAYTFNGTSKVSDQLTTSWSVPSVSSVTVMKAPWNGTAYGNEESAGLSASVSGNTVSVSGFDFTANYVGNHVSGSSTAAGGYKLIVRYPIAMNVADIASSTPSVNVSGSGSGLSDGSTLKSEFPASSVPLYTLNLSRTNLNAGESATYTVTKGGTTVGCCSITRPKDDTTPNYTGTACLKFSTSGTYTVTETIWNYGMSSTRQEEVTFSDSNPTITKSFSTTSKANDASHAEAQKTFSFN